MITTINSTDNGADSLVKINDNFTDLDTTKADLASPTFTGTPSLPTGTTAVTQSPGDSSTKIATTAFVFANASPITIETTTGTTHSLTTTAGQKVIVWAKGNMTSGDSSLHTFTLKYNSVTKDTVTCDPSSSSEYLPFSLMYTETPGAGTQNITVESDVSIGNVVIIVMKIG
jgi:hypothetical protein